MQIVKFEFSIIGEGSEFQNIGPKSAQNRFDAEIRIEQKKTFVESIELVIHSGIPFSQEDYLLFAKGKENDILHKKMAINSIKSSNVKAIGFKNSKILSLGLFKSTTKKYGTTTFSLDSITLSYKATQINNSLGSVFFLNDFSRKLVHPHYIFQNNKDHSQWKASSNLSDLQVGNFIITTSLNFNTNNKDEHETLIEKMPVLKINHSGSSLPEKEEFVFLADIICAILSFYRGEIIDFTYSEVYSMNLMHSTYKISNRSNDQKSPYLALLYLGFEGSHMSFLEKINFNFVLKKRIELIEFIHKYLFSKNLKSESKFMLLYNIFEQLKVTFDFDNKEDTFKFTKPKSETNKFILSQLEAIASIVHESDKDDFLIHVNNHIKTIKYKKMKDQYSFLFKTYLPEFQIEQFNPLIKMRNDIFHGHRQINADELAEANKKLKLILGQLLFNILTNP